MNALCPTLAPQRRKSAFSLVEMLAAVAIIGVITFLAIPNLVRMRGDAERNVAIARAEAINMAMATLIQVRGRTTASSAWSSAATDQDRYALLTPYLAYAETNLTDYVPGGYSVTFNTIDPLRKVTLKAGTNPIAY